MITMQDLGCKEHTVMQTVMSPCPEAPFDDDDDVTWCRV